MFRSFETSRRDEWMIKHTEGQWAGSYLPLGDDAYSVAGCMSVVSVAD